MNLYELFGVTENVTDEELTAAYERLREKYREDRWLDGEAGNEAARKLTELENAYKELTVERKRQSKNTTGPAAFEEIGRLIKEGDVNAAQAILDDFNERNAEWHYYQAVVFYKKGWMNDSKKQLEIAIQMDADNNKYREALGKLNAKADYEKKEKEQSTQNQQQSNPYGPYGAGGQPQMGGGTMCDDCCRCCAMNMCLNCAINMCCGCR